MFDQAALQYLLEGHEPYVFVQQDELPSDVVAVREGVRLESLERFQEMPDRIKATAELASSDSFCAYINRFKGKDTSIYINVDDGRFAAFLDHYGMDSPAWCGHVAQFAPKKSLDWIAWNKIHEEWLGQVPFAVLIEQLLYTIHEPEPNVVLKAALDFQANEKLVLGSTQNLDDSTVRFNFQKENANKSVTFPHRLKLRLAVHENEEKQLFDGRVRYRASAEGVLTFKFSFVKDPRAIERDAMLLLAEKTKAATEGLAHYEGNLKPVR